ncbi:TM0106 family RecB-like putative nuclease [Naumannella halotolerans]|uniref:TM0106 family RecB-like putative nuclease n=1 Tax=Naumannella halotolerans TaxID=993414 RepID=UPI00370DAE57
MTRLLLDAYAARSCAVKTHNQFDRTISLPVVDLVEAANEEIVNEAFIGGTEHRRLACDELLGAITDSIDLRESTDRRAATAEAVHAGTVLIVAPLLPSDLVGHRRGGPTALLRGPNRRDGSPGYYPVLTRFSKVLERLRQSKASESRRGSVVRLAPLGSPQFACSRGRADLSVRSRQQATLLEASHHWRMLQAAGWAPDSAGRAAIISTDDQGLIWVDLTQEFIRTYSASSETGWRLRSPLQRYDHEHDFRVRVAERALSRTGAADDPPPLVRPIRVRECDNCQWWQVCRDQLDSDDLSVRIDKAPLDVREIAALRTLGVETTHDLMNADLDLLKIDYLPRVRHRHGAERRIEMAARRARLLARGVELERITNGPIELPQADIEVDFDIETSRAERVYLWGFRVHDRGRDEPPTFVEFSAWHELDADAERELGARAMRWLRSLTDTGRSVRVYHYSDYEVVQLRRLAAEGDPDLRWGLEFAKDGFCDLFRVVADHFFGAHGLGLKTVATKGAGFHWRDADPGGLNSLTWFDTAAHAADPVERETARRRVLAYNEDDVIATFELRRWLREQ